MSASTVSSLGEAPLSTILLSVAILGEPLTAWMIAGTALVLAGIWMLTRSKK